MLAIALSSCSESHPVTDAAIDAWEKAYTYSGEDVKVVSFRKQKWTKWQISGTTEYVMECTAIIEYLADVPGPFDLLLHKKGDRVREFAQIPFIHNKKGWVVDEYSIQLGHGPL